ncbi:VanZ family protein [Nocardioides sp. YIM 152315]|uniref:VanZ family protein n=1 Tax=Nocardioides sp. YIM 152315 TaxID=3031760 RepID=UPI0023DC89E8|nr:VanZ family protein [Nocardioides sp. YIM 152315]MDF1604281.1 VanZ family protein [Nocardioides sp. YIM 152315]
MFPVGGVGVMLALIALAGGLCGLVAVTLRPRLGVVTAWSIAGLLWSLAIIGSVTLIPANGAPGIVSAEGRLETCSWDIGGPAPEGFWIFAGGQRMLNTLIFVPAGALLVLAVARWPRAAVVLVPVGLLVLIGYSVAIEATQLALARIDRACDVTDVVDNVTGAILGVGIGIVLALAFRPWRHRRRA